MEVVLGLLLASSICVIPVQGLIWLALRRENQTYRRLLRMQMESNRWRLRK
jgi:hypothetical protein